MLYTIRKGQMRSNNFIDLTGQVFERLTVIRLSQYKNSNGKLLWECVCSCGKSCLAPGGGLTKGGNKSCGCLQIERTKKANTTHGQRNTRLYRIWQGMKLRCMCPDVKDYQSYGARGIRLCIRWHKFENFLADMGHPPTPSSSIERIDNNKSYSKSNCKWATPLEQANNRRNNLVIELNGVSRTAAQWDRHFGFYPGTTASRHNKGIPIDRPVNKNLSRDQKKFPKSS